MKRNKRNELWEEFKSQKDQIVRCSDNQQIDDLLTTVKSKLGGVVSIWILDPPTKNLSGCTHTGLKVKSFDHKNFKHSSIELVIKILKVNSNMIIDKSSKTFEDLNFTLLCIDNWNKIHSFPILFGDKIIGSVFYVQKDKLEITIEENKYLKDMSKIAEKIIESDYHKRENHYLSNVVKLMQSSLDFDQSMQYLVKAARDLTAAESSTLFLYNARTKSYEVGFRSPYVRTQPKSAPRSKGGLTWKIMENGKPIKINDTTKDKNVRESVIKRGVLSIIGVRVQLEDEKIGVLYINGNEREQFTNYDTDILLTLSDYASISLGTPKFFLKPTEEIELAVDKIFSLDKLLENMSKKVQRECKFDYISIQLIDRKEKIIETVYGKGISKKWVGLAKHYIENTDYLRDLQADIVQSQCTEIFNGNDERLDPYIYESLQEKKISRITTPIMLFRDVNGDLLRTTPKQYSWNVLADLKPDEIVKNADINENTTQYTILGLCNNGKKVKKKYLREVIGTVGSGYDNATKRIDPKNAIKLNKIIAKRAVDIYQTSLISVLEVIVQCAMNSIRADSATLHFLRNPDDNSYVYEVCAGSIDREFLKRHPPRNSGIGYNSLKSKSPKFIPDLAIGQKLSHLKNENPMIFKEGIKAIAAFPLIVDEKKGVLYIHFHKQHRFTEDEIKLVKIFSKRATDAIRHATAYKSMRNSARRLSVLNNIAQTLARTPRGGRLLHDIVWVTLNLFAADVVTIYEYLETEKKFITPPEIAGKLKNRTAMDTAVKKNDVPFKILSLKKNVWAENSQNKSCLKSNKKNIEEKIPFVIREGIKSSAAIKLKVDNEIVGLMFINYRRKHSFEEDEKKVILTLAASAAIAIKNRRLMEYFSKVDKELLTKQDYNSLLNLIVKKSVQISKADIGELRLVEYDKQALNLKAKYPFEANKNVSPSTLKINEGICGYVATTGKAMLIKDVQKSPHYFECNPNIKSELCVPLIDRNMRIIGILNLESYNKNTFDIMHQRMLESLANRAVLAIQNADYQRRLIAGEALSDIGVITSHITHKIGSAINTLKIRALDIIDSKNNLKKIGEYAKDIEKWSDTIIDEIRLIQDWAEEDRTTNFSIRDVLHEIVNVISIPKNIKVEYMIEPNIGHLNFSAKQFFEMLAIIVQNSLDAMPDGGRLVIGGHRTNNIHHNFINIFIQDTGTGISKENLDKIFGPKFSRNKDGKGFGFGLWAAKKVVELLGGEIKPHSTINKGTEFEIIIPVND